jgi:hypothetical protein
MWEEPRSKETLASRLLLILYSTCRRIGGPVELDLGTSRQWKPLIDSSRKPHLEMIVESTHLRVHGYACFPRLGSELQLQGPMKKDKKKPL